MEQLVDRMIRAAKLDAALYEEVEADRSAMGQAAAAVVLASLAAGIGSPGSLGIIGMIRVSAFALILWLFWAMLTWVIGTRLLPAPQTEADIGQMLRTTGFAAAPGLLRILGIIPGFYLLSSLVAGIWMLAAMVVAVRQALDYPTTGRAFAVCLIGWIFQFFLFRATSGAVLPGVLP